MAIEIGSGSAGWGAPGDWVTGGGIANGGGGRDDDGGGGGTGGGSGPGNPGGPTFYDTVVPETGTLQILLGEGEIDGLGPVGTATSDWLKYIYLDDVPIMNPDGTKNFKGVALALVMGSNSQVAVKGVTAIESTTPVNVQMTYGNTYVRTITSNPSGVRVRVAIPALKWVDAATGKTYGNSVQIKIEKKNANTVANGGTNGVWVAEALHDTGFISGGPFSSEFTKSYRVDTPATGQWDIRVSRLTANDSDAYHASQTYWKDYTEIVDAQLRYPNSAVLCVRVNAKQFKTIPKVTVLARLVKIQYPDPAHISGGVWDGTFTTGWSNNPAWVFYDAATKTRYGAGDFLQASGLDIWSLYAIGVWCDTLVPDGVGGTEKRMTANLYVQGQQSVIKALGMLSSIFWGVLYYTGGLVTPVADSDDSPVAIFSNANVKDGRFSYEGSARQARHTSAIATFMNPDLAYEPDTAVYENEDAIRRYGHNPMDIQAIGATTQGQALRLAKWAILSELMSDELVTFTSGLPGSTLRPGDIIQISDQFRAGSPRFGGIIIGCTNTTNAVVTLDSSVTLSAGTYTLQCQTANGTETKTVTTGAGTWTSLTVSGTFVTAPVAGAAWLLSLNSSTKSLWRVLSLTSDGGMEYSIAALYHDPAKYAALDLSVGDVVKRDTPRPSSGAPQGLTLYQSVRVLSDRQCYFLCADWLADGASKYIAECSSENGPWIGMTITNTTASMQVEGPGSYRVRVAGLWKGAGMSPYTLDTYTVTADATIPDWISDGRDGVAQINSVDYLANTDKIELRKDWDAEQNTKTQLDALAAAYGQSATAYDNAVAAISTGLIAAGAPANWATTWPDGTTSGPWTAIMTNLRGWWSTIATEREALSKACSDRIYANTLIALPEVGSWATFGALPTAGTGYTGNYPLGKFVYSTVIVDTAGDNTAGTLYKNVAGTWTRQGVGSLIVGKLVAGQASIGSIAANSLVADFVLANKIRSGSYTETAGTGVPTAGFKNDAYASAVAWSSGTTYSQGQSCTYSGYIYTSKASSNTNHQPSAIGADDTYWYRDAELKAGFGWFGNGIKLGTSGTTLGDLTVRALSGIATSGTSATDMIWWRGNNNPNINGGAPVIVDPLWALDQTWAVGDRRVAGSNTSGIADYTSGRWVYECTTAGAGLTTAQSTSSLWSAATTYSAGQTVRYASGFGYFVWSSKAGGNLNHTPPTVYSYSDTYWDCLGYVYGPIGTLRTTDAYYDGASKWKCVGWMHTSVNTSISGCRGWMRSTAYTVGDLVIADVPTGTGYTQSYVADNSKMYGHPIGAAPAPYYSGGSAVVVYGGTRVYRCVTTGTSAATGQGPTGTGTSISDSGAAWDYWSENTGSEDRLQLWGINANGSGGTDITYECRIQPKTNKDNLDAITHLEAEILGLDGNWKGFGANTRYNNVFTAPSRKYYSPSTPAHINNMVRFNMKFDSATAADGQFYVSGAAPYALQAIIRCRLHNSNGASAAVDYGNWASQNIYPTPYCNRTQGAASGGGGGGGGDGGGSYCPEPWVLLTTARGQVRADEIVVGDVVETRHETSGLPGVWPVTEVSTGTNETAMLIARKTMPDGTSSIMEVAFALDHRFVRDKNWVELREINVGAVLESTDGSRIEVLAVEPRGVNDVVKITVDDAHTYSTFGLLSHNIKILN